MVLSPAGTLGALLAMPHLPHNRSDRFFDGGREGNESALSCVIDQIAPQGCMFVFEFPHQIAMEDALDEINEILERKILKSTTP